MKQHFSKALALFLAVVMVISVLPVMAFAVDPGTPAPFLSALPEDGSYGVIYNADGYVMGFDLENGRAPAKQVSLSADGGSISDLPNGAAVFKFIKTGSDYYMTLGGKYLTVKDLDAQNTEKLVLTDGVETGSKWSFIPDKGGAAGFWNILNLEYKWNGGDVYLEQYKGQNFSAYSYQSNNPGYFQMKIAATEADEDGRVGEIMEAGELPADGSKVVVYNDYAKAVFGQPTGADIAAPALLPAAATLGTDGSLAYEDVEDGGMIFTVHTGVDGGTTWYSFESGGKYLAMPENTVDENGQVGNDETLLMIELPTDPEKVGYTRWTMTQISGGYVMYNVSARYRSNKCCIEYFNDTFSGWTYKSSTPELFAMNFFQMEDRDGVGYVSNPSVKVFESFPTVGVDCSVGFGVQDVSEPTEITVGYFTDKDPAVRTPELDFSARTGAFTVPAAELEGAHTLTVQVSITDALGKSYSDELSMEIIDEPQLVTAFPAPNAATGDVKRPEIYMTFANVGENPVFVMELDEQTVPAVVEGEKLSYTPTEDLEDGRHSVRVSVTRADGKQAERSWNFFVGRDNETLYFGQLHSHTAEYSDGAGTLENAYMHAADVEDMDFLIVTDHSNYFDTTSTATTSSYYDLTPLLKNAAGTVSKWEEARATAREYDLMFPDLLCVYGYEMTWSGGPGHTNTFNTYGVVSRNNGSLNNKTGYAGMHLYNDLMVNAEKGLDISGEEAKTIRDGGETTGVYATKNIAFDELGNPVPVVSQFNHPGKTFGNFDNYAGFNAQRDDVLNLIEVGNGEGKVGGSSYFPSYSEYDLCLSKGWHVGPTNNQDNHKGGWGSSNSCRDVILTGDFSEAGLYRALDQRRIYATEDQNLRLFYELEANGETYKLGDVAPISEDEQPETVTAKIDVTDPDRLDNIATVEIIGEAGKTVHKINVNDVAWKGEISIPNTEGYYYVRIVEADGQIAVTAPVWVKEAIPVAADLESSAAVAAQGEEETITAKLTNGSESEPLTLTGYKVEAEGRTLVEETDLSETVAAGAVKTLEVPFTPSATDPSAVKTYDISVSFIVLFKGKELVYTKTISETSYPPEMMTYIGLDKGHDNFYVSGDYAGNEGNFIDICAQRGILVKYIDKGEMTKENLARFKAVLITVPRVTGDGYPTVWTAEELEALADYAAKGGTVLNFSKSDRYDPDDPEDAPYENYYSSANLSNMVNEAVGAKTRFLRGIVVDNEHKSGESAYRIYFDGRELIGDHLFTEGIFPSSNGSYQWYNGTGITIEEGADVCSLIDPYDTTWVANYKANFDGASYVPDYENDVVMAEKGSGFSLATAEKLSGGGYLVCSGATFISNYDLKYGDPANQQYENYSLVCNILDYIRDGAFEGEVTPIADVHNGEVGQEFTVEGIVTSNASDYDKDTAFFDCIYVQDETRGINAFPVSGYYFIGEKVRVHGGVTYYCGEIELNLSNDYHGSIKVISNDITPLEPKAVSCAEAMSDANIGNLMKITGTITDYRATAGVVDEIWVDDGSGEEAMFFINAYIQKESQALDGIEVGMMIEGVGIGSRDVDEESGGADGQIGDDVDPSLFIKRLRVRSRDEFEIWGAELDTTLLEAAIAEAQGLDRSRYTPESLAAVDEALEAALAVMANPDKTQRQVEEAYDALRAALDALEEKTEHDLYAPVKALKDGDVVVIYNPGHQRAVKNGNYRDWYMLAGEVTFNTDMPEAIQDPAAELLWTVHVDEDGNYSFTNGENAITMWKSGNYAELTNNAAIEGGDVLWNLTLGNEEEQLYYFTSKTIVNGDKAGYMECYDKKNAEGNYEPFMVGYFSNSPADKDYGFRFYKFAYGPEESEPVGELAGKTVILHTNDTHGALMGFAQVAKVKADLEAQGATVLLVDAGDYSQGNPYVSLSKGETAITVMNAAGYDYATLGNHEFDYGWPQLRENLSKATFQPIVADVIDEATGKSVYDGHAIKEVDGVKIGFFGMETPEAATKANPALMVGLRFPQAEEMYAIAQAEIDALKAEGADLVICLAHLGVDAESEPNRSTDLFAHVTGLDFIIDGHSHTVMTEGPDGEPIQSTGTKASDTALANLGYICIDNATKRIEEHKLIPLGADAPVDETVAAVAREIMEAVDAEYNVVFARSEVELNGDRAPGNRNMETNLGDLITDAMLWSVAKTGGLTVDADHVVAITNGGGIRAWIHAGDVTKKDVNTVLPFGNTVAVVYVSGAELLEALEASTYCTPTAVGGFPQVSGMKFSVCTYLPFLAGEQYPGSTYYGPKAVRRVTIEEIGGKAFDPEATYAVVTNNFCAAGGDTYYAFKAATSQFDTGLPLDEVLMDYIVEELDAVIGAEYAEPQGRITIHEHFDDVTSQEQYYYDPVYWAVA
ncbi:MAG: 5'-nucleotidase C-terminal domain-containing protein, partial [Oscillospiraceae bacterium]|nr:5'-nucleotidase C-terminal domain-containing protein [Oscillospiraceae bacterium]